MLVGSNATQVTKFGPASWQQLLGVIGVSPASHPGNDSNVGVILKELGKWSRLLQCILEQNPPNHKIDGGLCLYPPFSTSKDSIFIA